MGLLTITILNKNQKDQYINISIRSATICDVTMLYVVVLILHGFMNSSHHFSPSLLIDIATVHALIHFTLICELLFFSNSLPCVNVPS